MRWADDRRSDGRRGRAGTRRGSIDNALSIGYVDRQTGEFVSVKTSLGIRDALYVNFINPLVFFTGNGLLNYGNKTSFKHILFICILLNGV